MGFSSIFLFIDPPHSATFNTIIVFYLHSQQYFTHIHLVYKYLSSLIASESWASCNGPSDFQTFQFTFHPDHIVAIQLLEFRSVPTLYFLSFLILGVNLKVISKLGAYLSSAAGCHTLTFFPSPEPLLSVAEYSFPLAYNDFETHLWLFLLCYLHCSMKGLFTG